MASLPDLSLSLFPAWQKKYQELSLPFVLCQTASPEVVLGLVERGWIRDFNELSAEGIPLAGYLYIRSPQHSGGLEPDTLPALDDLSGHRYGPRKIDDFGPVVTALVRAGADPWLRWEGGMAGLNSTQSGLTTNAGPLSLLHCAIAKGDAGMVQWLLAHPQCPSASELSTWGVERDLARFKSISGHFLATVVSEKLKAGLLHLAANSNSDAAPAIVRMLVSAGLDPNVPDSDGRVPLFYVRRRDVLDLLLEKGANPSPVSAALFAFWRMHLGTSQTLAEFQGPVLARMAQDQSPDELRKANETTLVNTLMTGNKTNVQSLLRKAKFSYDYKIKLASGDQWNLVTPVLLRQDLTDKVDPLLRWLGGHVDWQEDLGGGATNLGLSLLRHASWHWARHHESQSLPSDKLMELLDAALDRATKWMSRPSLYSVLSSALSVAVLPALDRVKVQQGYQGLGASGRSMIPGSFHYSLNSNHVWDQAKKVAQDPDVFIQGLGNAARLAKVARAVVCAQTKYWTSLEKQGKPLVSVSASEMGLILSRISMLMADPPDQDSQKSFVYLSLLASSFGNSSVSDVWAAHKQVVGEPVRAIKSTHMIEQIKDHLVHIDTSNWEDKDLQVIQDFCQKSPGELSEIQSWVCQQRLSRFSQAATAEGRPRAPRM